VPETGLEPALPCGNKTVVFTALGALQKHIQETPRASAETIQKILAPSFKGEFMGIQALINKASVQDRLNTIIK
jgi:hypothetical protein